MTRRLWFQAAAILTLGLAAGRGLAQTEVKATYLGTQESLPAGQALPRVYQVTPAAPSIQFNAAAVGISAGSAQVLTATFNVSGNPGSPFTPTAALHYGLNFTVGTVTCTGPANSQTCTVPVTFLPTLPGARKDALTLLSGSTVLATVFLGGIGQAPLALVQPGVVTSPILNGGYYYYKSIVGEDGTAYVLSSNSNIVFRVTSTGVVTQLPITGLQGPNGIAIDGAGTLYIAQNTYSHQIITYTAAGVQGAITVNPPAPYVPCSNGGSLEYLLSVAVDQAGNLFAIETLCSNIFELKNDGTYAVTPISPSITQPSTMAVDSAGNVFVGGYTINELTAGGVETQVNAVGASDGLGVDAADTLYATRYTGTGGVAELPASNYGTFQAALDPSAPPLGTSVGPDGTVWVGNYTNLDKVDRSQGVIAFGEQTSGTASTAQNVAIYNGGNEPLNISNIAISGTGFAIQAASTNNCSSGIMIAPGAFCQVAATLTVPHAGIFSGSLVFTTNSLNSTSSTQTVALSGYSYGVYVTPSPTSLTFGSQTVGTTSAAQTITLTNNGDLYAAGIYTPVSGSSAFNVTLGTCTSALNVGSSCQLSVTFTPTAAQTYSNVSVSVSYVSSGGGVQPPPVTFTLNGTGTAPPAPAVSLAPTTLAFGGQDIGTTSATRTVSLTNTGTAALTVTGISLTGTNPSAFAQTNNCGSSVAAGASCNIVVAFTPAAAQAYSATLSVADNVTGSPQTIPLTGTGVAFVSNVGTALAPQALTVVLPNGGTVGSIQVLTQGQANLDFTLSSGGTCATGTAYTAGQSCTVNVVFKPVAAGLRQGAVLLTDSSNNVLATAYLPGTGVGPMIVFGPGKQSTLPMPSGGFSAPLGIAVDSAGNVYVPDTLRGSVDKLTPSGSTYSAPAPLPLTGLNQPSAVAVDGNGNVWIADTNNSRVVELPWTGSSYGTQMTLTSSVSKPEGIAVDGAGNVYIADTLNKRIVEVPWTGTGYGAQIVLPVTGLFAPHQLVVDANGDLFITNSGATQIVELPNTASGFGAQLNVPTNNLFYPEAVAVDANGDVYIADYTANQVLEVPWNGTAFGTQLTVPMTFTGTSILTGMAVDALGNLYVTDGGNGDAVKLDVSDPPALSFASTNVGSTSTDSPKTVPATNIGNASLTFATLGSGSNPSYPANFPVNNADTKLCGSSAPLLRGASCDVSVSFTPTAAGSLTGNVVLTDNALYGNNVTQSIAVNGTGVAPAAVASITPNPLAFPATPVGSQANAPTPMTLTNTGTAPLTISGISITGANASSFSETNLCGTTLAAGASCGITVVFNPTAAGALTANVSVADNATGSPQIAVLTGTGTVPVVTLNPTSLSFGNQQVNTTSGPQSLTITNSGGAPLQITSALLSGPFNEITTCPTVIAAGASCTYTFSFTPLTTGAQTGSIVFTDNASGSPQTVQFTGTGTAAPAPLAVLTPSSLGFPSTTVGSTAAAQMLTLSNPGNAALSISSIVIAGANPADFGQTNTCGTSLGASATCTISVTFTPATAASFAATVLVSDNAATSQQSATLSGTGTQAPAPQALLSPTSLSFPNTTAGTSSSALPVTLSNPGNAALTIAGISIAGSNASSFTQTNTCGTSLASGASCTISVTFAPAFAYTGLSATLTVSDNATGSPQTATLTGTAVAPPAPAANLSPATLAFPNTNVGTTSSALTGTLSNPGTAPLTISGISITGSNASSFAQTNTCGTSLAAGASCTISVTFTPGAAGSFSASLSVADNVTGSPQTAALTGTGVAVAPTSFTVSTSTPTASVQPGSVATYNLIIAPVGGSYSNVVTLSATGLPAGAVATFAPPSVTPGAAGAPSTLSIQTASGLARLHGTEQPGHTSAPLLALFAGVPLLGLAGALRRLRSSSRRWMLVALAALAVLPMLALSGCGGGYFSQTPQTYTVTVTGTSGSLQESTTISLTVQ